MVRTLRDRDSTRCKPFEEWCHFNDLDNLHLDLAPTGSCQLASNRADYIFNLTGDSVHGWARATHSYDEAILNSDITFVIVPTSSDKDRVFSNKCFVAIMRSIGRSRRQDWSARRRHYLGRHAGSAGARCKACSRTCPAARSDQSPPALIILILLRSAPSPATCCNRYHSYRLIE